MRTRWMVLIVAAAALVAAPIVALASTTTVDMQQSYTFSPKTATVAMGGTVQWKNTSSGLTHTATQYTKLHLWDTGAVSPGSSVNETIKFAGSYPYHCIYHYMLGMTGTVKVPVKVSPASGSTSTTFTVTLATVDAPSAFVYDVQMKNGSSGTWTMFMQGVTKKSVTFQPTAAGTYYFRSRLRRVKNGATSNWSPARSVSVSS